MYEEYVNYEKEKLKKFVEWLGEYPEIWDEICESNHDISAERCCRIIENLESNSLHILIPMFVYKNRHSAAVYAAIHHLVVNCILEVWEQKGRYAMCQTFKDMVQEQKEKAELRRMIERKDRMKE